MTKFANYAFSCVMVLLSLADIAFVIVAGIILSATSHFKGSCQNVWAYCVLMTVGTGLSFLNKINKARVVARSEDTLTDTLKKIDRKHDDITIAAIALALLIWGAIIYANISTECKALYTSGANNLWILYMFSFWYTVAAFCLVVLLLTCVCTCTCCVLAVAGEVNRSTPDLESGRAMAHMAQQRAPAFPQSSFGSSAFPQSSFGSSFPQFPQSGTQIRFQ